MLDKLASTTDILETSEANLCNDSTELAACS